VRCDRGHPYCGWCVRNGQTCEYKERKKPGLRAGYGRELEARLGVYRVLSVASQASSCSSLGFPSTFCPPFRRILSFIPAHRTQYGLLRLFAKRCVDKLEGVLSTQQQVLHQLADHLSAGQHSAGPMTATSSTQSHHVPQAEAALFMQTPNLYQSTGVGRYGSMPAHGSNDQAHPRHGPTPSLQLPAGTSAEIYPPSHSTLDSPGLHIAGATQPGLTSPGGSMGAVSQDQDFPPYDLLYALSDLFFKHINTWCPILHRRTTLDALFGPVTLEEADRILLHAIVATTLRYSTDSRLSEQSRERYHSLSKQKVLLYGLENSSVKALQALVILALDILGTSNGPPGWNLLALITRSVVQLGLSVETTSASVAPIFPSIYTLRAMVLPEPKSFIEDESRRRLFWMVYLLDRYATISTAFEFALDDKEIDRKLPCRDDLVACNQSVDTRWFHTEERTEYSMNKPENLGSFSYYIEIIGILSQIHRFLKKPVDIGALSDVEQWQQEYRQLDNKLNAWKFGLPSEYGNMSRLFNPTGGNKIVNCIWIMLHITYHT